TFMLAEAERLRADGETVTIVAVDGRLVGLIGVADPIKPSTPDALRMLRECGLRVVMVTGDSRRTAEAVARKLGIEHIEAEVLPDQKRSVVLAMQTEGRRVAMAGDGGNDGPSVGHGYVGIALGCVY